MCVYVFIHTCGLHVCVSVCGSQGWNLVIFGEPFLMFLPHCFNKQTKYCGYHIVCIMGKIYMCASAFMQRSKESTVKTVQAFQPMWVLRVNSGSELWVLFLTEPIHHPPHCFETKSPSGLQHTKLAIQGRQSQDLTYLHICR